VPLASLLDRLKAMASILVVDDEAAPRSTAALLLEKRGHRVQAADGVVAAVTLLAQQSFDIVVTDLRMPDGVGLEVLRAAKAHSPETHVILLTAYPGWQSAKEAIRLGALDYIEKGEEPAELFARIDIALAARATRAAARRARGSLDDERRAVTVLFADLRGSLELLGTSNLEDARRLLDSVLGRMVDAVDGAGGIVNQVLGDGIMALFGAVEPMPDHAARACLAALDMHERVAACAGGLPGARRAEPAIRVGINSGEVLLRSLDTAVGRDYTAVGPATHLAARMEQLALPGSTLITAETRRLAGNTVQVKPRGCLEVKGLAGRVEAFELLGPAKGRAPEAQHYSP
jgi:class 3 adenylate cyclase